VSQTSGHFFITKGDLTTLDCDALLLPTDVAMFVTRLWSGLVGRLPDDEGPLRDFASPPGWGDSVHTCLYSNPAGRAPAVWLTNVGHLSKGQLLDNVRAFLDEASKLSRRSVPRLALPAVATAAGGHEHDKGMIFESLVPFLSQYAAANPVDIVLVTRGRKHYAAAQRARKRMEGLSGATSVPSWDLGPRNADLSRLSTELAEACTLGQLVPFMGAGISLAAGVPGWQALLDELFIEAQIGSESDLKVFRELDARDQASLVRQSYGDDDDYHGAISSRIRRERHSLSHGLLASLGTVENVTTNYDELFELACGGSESELAVLPYEPVERDRSHRWLLKLHGTLAQPEDMVFTRDDYLGLPSRSGALFGLVQAMLLTRHMLFVGYSLSDESFHKVLHEVRAARRGTRRNVVQETNQDQLGTALVLHAEPLFHKLFEQDLNIVPVAEPDEDFDTAARRFEIFLDHLAYQAADVSPFLLDPTYSSMLDPAEQKEAELLLEVQEHLDAGPIGMALRSVLSRFGSPNADGWEMASEAPPDAGA